MYNIFFKHENLLTNNFPFIYFSLEKYVILPIYAELIQKVFQNEAVRDWRPETLFF